MGFETAHDAIEERFAANWTATPIKWENVPFPNQPLRTATTPAWVSLTVRGNQAGGRISIGATVPLRRFPYTIINQVFTPEDTGTAQARTYADTVSAIWRDASFAVGATGTIRCFEPNIIELGPDGTGWYQVNVITPFHYDDTFA